MRPVKLLDEARAERHLELVGLSAITHIGEQLMLNLGSRNSFALELSSRRV